MLKAQDLIGSDTDVGKNNFELELLIQKEK